MKPIFRSWFRSRKSRIERRLDNTRDTATHRPVLSARTIETHKYEMMRVLGVQSTAELIALAVKRGLA